MGREVPTARVQPEPQCLHSAAGMFGLADAAERFFGNSTASGQSVARGVPRSPSQTWPGLARMVLGR
jgi:hypothetical protein